MELQTRHASNQVAPSATAMETSPFFFPKEFHRSTKCSTHCFISTKDRSVKTIVPSCTLAISDTKIIKKLLLTDPRISKFKDPVLPSPMSHWVCYINQNTALQQRDDIAKCHRDEEKITYFIKEQQLWYLEQYEAEFRDIPTVHREKAS